MMLKKIFPSLLVGTVVMLGGKLSSIHNLPGDTTLPSPQSEIKKLISHDTGIYHYRVEDFVFKPNRYLFKLSPDGKYLSYKKRDPNGKSHIYIRDLQSNTAKRVVEEKEQLIRKYGWINHAELYYLSDNNGDEKNHIFIINIENNQTKDMTPFIGVTAEIYDVLENDENKIIVVMNKENRRLFDAYLLDTHTGEFKKLSHNDDISSPIEEYIFDKEGKLRGYTKAHGLQRTLLYKNSQKNIFEPIKSFGWDETFSILSFDYSSKNPDQAYILSDLKGDKRKIYLYDLKKDTPLKEIFSHKEYDAEGLIVSRKRHYAIDAFLYTGEKPIIVPESDYFKNLYKDIAKKLGNTYFKIVNKTKSEDMFLILEESDRIYGQYYLYDTNNKKLTLLDNLKPNLDPKEMANMKPISFKSRDGVLIHGYITLPSHIKKGQKIPMIVHPHGGPQDTRDTWGFDRGVQLFASRGYAVLQINFRISGGYGKKFSRLGFKQIGAKVMDDVEDGVLYAIKNEPIDKNKIAIYGASHGGYATLMGLIRTPKLYACGIDFVGVSNIETFMHSMPPYWNREVVKAIWYDVDSPKESILAKKYSPVYQADKIETPLFVIQGGNDPRVNIHESDQIVKKLRSKGYDVPYMVKYNEGHGYYREENVLQAYKAMMGFFAKHLKSNSN